MILSAPCVMTAGEYASCCDRVPRTIDRPAIGPLFKPRNRQDNEDVAADGGLMRSRRQYDLDGQRKYTGVARFHPRLASRSPLLRRPQDSAVRTSYRAECFP